VIEADPVLLVLEALMALPAARARKENAALLVLKATPVLKAPLVLMVLEDKLVSP
jgi:hypothetical protein